ncbi:MAG: nitroreductase family protein [Candidatus Margulisiibacteriota bacterium]|jgi:hypothetical protein
MHNPVFEAINNRRSVRNFTDKPIPKETLAAIVRAGTLAPTGANAQPCAPSSPASPSRAIKPGWKNTARG